jgi:hypothetical protein
LDLLWRAIRERRAHKKRLLILQSPASNIADEVTP